MALAHGLACDFPPACSLLALGICRPQNSRDMLCLFGFVLTAPAWNATPSLAHTHSFLSPSVAIPVNFLWPIPLWLWARFHFQLHQLLNRRLPIRTPKTLLHMLVFMSVSSCPATSFLSAHLFVISLYNPWNPSTQRGLRKDCWIYEEPSTGPKPTASLVVAIPDLKEDIIRHVWSGGRRALTSFPLSIPMVS